MKTGFRLGILLALLLSSSAFAAIDNSFAAAATAGEAIVPVDVGPVLSKIESLNRAVSGRLNLKKDGDAAQVVRASGRYLRPHFKLTSEVRVMIDQGKDGNRSCGQTFTAEYQVDGFFLSPQVEYGANLVTSSFKAGYRSPVFEGYLGYELDEETEKSEEEFIVGATYSF